MLLLLLLVTPLVNAVHDSWPSPCTCTLPQPLKTVNINGCVNGTWYGRYSTAYRLCYSITFTDKGNNTMDITVIETVQNECSRTIVTNYGTTLLSPNRFSAKFPCKPEWPGDYIILETDCENYVIYGHCPPGFCKPVYYIEFRSMTPSDCTMNNVQKDLKSLRLDWTDFCDVC